ncbi:MAG TPA: lysylphosphatidylglycerol synthase domain-containing protein [Actinomycetota bacterium]|nr:lysylphosphatidylglycerol synthase domain-containing protein [Actinomycetota bacterium]
MAQRRRIVAGVGMLLFAVAVVVVVRSADLGALGRTWRSALASPGGAAAALAAYTGAFALRAAVWSRIVHGLSFGHALAAIHVSLAGNHVLPLRLGEALRVTSVVRRARIPFSTATASTVMLRAADVLAVAGLAATFGPALLARLGISGWIPALPAGALWLAGLWWLRRLDGGRGLRLGRSAGVVAAAATVSWLLESAVIWQAARWAGIDLSPADAVLVTAVTIAAQVLAVAPGGIGTYEAAATAAMVALGAPAGAALSVAIAAHALKTAYALITGAIALFVPSPGALGRLRLPPPQERARVPRVVRDDAPIVLFLPAHDEEQAVGGVVRRAPRTILGHPVEVIVVDDGSNDATATAARRAGARVISFSANRGLGAAVRAGLAEGVNRGAAAIAFCDADGEYAPEELDRLVAPILRGDADYVVGSRFAGSPRRMLPHRLLGNVLLTRLLRFVARRPISDGQSGYRAFAPEAARDAEVIHDFNYAQVLTLDLLAKGYRYAEVPISYRFRQTGRSFVRLGRYLRRVVPAVYRELNTT